MNGLFRSVLRAVQVGAATCRPTNFDVHVSVVPARLFCGSAGENDPAEMVKKDKVVVFMKGTPAQPMCGFSNAVVQILRMHGVENYASYNVLEDQDLRQGQNRKTSRRGRMPCSVMYFFSPLFSVMIVADLCLYSSSSISHIVCYAY